jgi:hypothetical protein
LSAALDTMPMPPGDVYAAERDPMSTHAGIIRYNLNTAGEGS